MKKILLIVSSTIFLVTLVISTFIFFQLQNRNTKDISKTDSNGVLVYPTSSRVENVRKIEYVSGLLENVELNGNTFTFRIKEISTDDDFYGNDYFDISLEADDINIPLELWSLENSTLISELDAGLEFITDYIGYRIELEASSEDLYSDFTKINKLIVYENQYLDSNN